VHRAHLQSTVCELISYLIDMFNCKVLAYLVANVGVLMLHTVIC